MSIRMPVLAGFDFSVDCVIYGKTHPVSQLNEHVHTRSPREESERTMPKFQKRPVVIEAVQYHGPNFDEIEEFVGGDAEFRAGELIVATLEGPLRASPGDWIIKGIKGEFYPCKPDIFTATYEPVE